MTLRSLFARLGLLDQIVSNSGPQFTSEAFRKFTTANGIKHVTGAPYHPATNGQAEKFVQSFKMKMDDQTWKRHVEQLWDSYLCPPVRKATDECTVPEEEEQHGTPPIGETEWKDGQPTAVTSEEEVLSPEPESQQPSPQPELITTRAGRVVKPPQTFKDYVCN